MALHFTKQQIDEIERALIARAKKDTSFPGADILDGTELIPIIQNGVNKITTYAGLWNQVSKDLQEFVEEALAGKVDVVEGKELSDNNYTSEEKDKLAGISVGANVNVQADWEASSGDAFIKNKPDLTIYATRAAVQDIEALIPTQASTSNQLADKNFVNSSIATSTAEFKGTYSSLAELETVSANNNDYGYVVSTDSAGNTVYDRYKYNGENWIFEYSLNNSSFTAAEWAAIQSGITAVLVEKLSALPTNESLQNTLLAKVDKVSGKGLSTNDYTTAEKTKLSNIEANAQVNVLEGVKVDGTELPITDKKVNIDLSGKVDVAGSETNSDAFVYRQTGGGLNINADNARISSIKGKTLVWNQLLRNTFPVQTLSFGTISKENGIISLIVNESPGNNVVVTLGTFDTVASHMYIWLCSNDLFKINNAWIWGTSVNSYTSSKLISSTSLTKAQVGIRIPGDIAIGTYSFSILVIDLTLMFGAGNEPATVAEFEALFPLPYYEYNAGTLISNDAVQVETTGFNLWDEEWEVGSIGVDGQDAPSSVTLRSKNYIPVIGGMSYCFNNPSTGVSGANIYIAQYDVNKARIKFDGIAQSQTSVVTLDPRTAFVRFATAYYIREFGTYRNDICINLSNPAKNGTYEPYWERVLPLGLNSFRVTDGTNIITVNGLKSAGSVYDEIDPVRKKYIKRIGEVDLGTLNWGYNSNFEMFYVALTSMKQRGNAAHGISTVLCTKYATTGENYAGLPDKSVSNNMYAYSNSANVLIKDSDYSDAAAFKIAMSGVMLYYELNTPEEYDLVEPIRTDYPVDRLGTERIISDTVPTPPFLADITYHEANIKDIEIEGITDYLKREELTDELDKLGTIEEGAQVNKIEHIQINGTEQTITNKTVNLPAYPDITGKQDTLVSGTNIKTINNESILGSGNITIGIEAAAGTHINEVGTPTVTASTSGNTTTFSFDYLKGATGQNGTDGTNGTSAGFGTPTATIGTGIGTPSVTVTASGPDTAKVFAFAFDNLKGEKGDTGEPAVAVENHVTVEATAQTTAATDVLPATGDADTVYRVANWDGTQYDDTAYTEYGWYNGAYKQLATRAPGIDNEPTANSNNLVKSGGVAAQLSQLGQKVIYDVSQIRQLKNSIQDLNGDSFYIADKNGYVVAKINANGIEAIEVKVGDKKLSEQPTHVGITDIIPELYPSELYITDGNGNVVAYIDSDGIHSINILVESLPVNLWAGKNVATYGDSITAINNGDFEKPYNQDALSAKWGNKVAKYFDFNKQIGRGVGSTCFMWRPSGGQVAWVKTATGLYENRNDSYTYDNYEGHVTIPADCTPIRGDGCSWLRITSMFPAAIKDNIDAVLVMFHNDFHQDMNTDVIWQPNDTTDPEWAASTYYSTFNGDYNITTVKGGIASTVMKLQVWMPQARIILMTPISGVYATAAGLDGNFDNTESAKMKKLAECVKDVSSRMSIPCIDNYGNDGINSLNRTSYISDTIHPYTDAGCKCVAISVIGGLNGIIPSINY